MSILYQYFVGFIFWAERVSRDRAYPCWQDSIIRNHFVTNGRHNLIMF